MSWRLIIVDNVYKGFSFIVCLTIVTLILIATFRPHSAGLQTCSVRFKRRDQYQSDNRETNDKTKPFINKICHFVVSPFSTKIRYTVTLVVQELPSVHLFWCLRNRWSCVLCVKITWVSNRSCWFLSVNDVYRLLRYYWRMSRTLQSIRTGTFSADVLCNLASLKLLLL